MFLTLKLPFVVKLHVILLVCCYAQESSYPSSLQYMETFKQLPYSAVKDVAQEQPYTFGNEDSLPESKNKNGDGRQTYQSAGRFNHRCKGILCIAFTEHYRRHHHKQHKKSSTYHYHKTNHKHKKSNILKNLFSSPRSIESYKISSNDLNHKELPTNTVNGGNLLNSITEENTFFEKSINSTNDWTPNDKAKLHNPVIEMDIVVPSNKQKLIDSKSLSGRNDFSNFFPNHVSGLSKNFIENNHINQTNEKSKTLDKSVKKILQKQDLSSYFPSAQKIIDGDRASYFLSKKHPLKPPLNKNINYKYEELIFDHNQNKTRNSSGKLNSITEETRIDIIKNVKSKSNKVEMRSQLAATNTPQIQYPTRSGLIEAIFINKKFLSSDHKENSISEISFDNNIKSRLNGQKPKNPSLVSFVHQKPNSVEKPVPPFTESQCYSFSDLLMVVLITSLANLFVGFLITLTVCFISPRIRLLSSFRRTTESFSIGITHSRLNMSEEEISGNVGCLEACLPDISYQRHVARDMPKGKITSKRFNSCFHHFQQRKKGLTVSQPNSQDYGNLHEADQSPLIVRKTLSLEDLSST